MKKLLASVACLFIASPVSVSAGVAPYAHDDTAVVRMTCGIAVGTGVKLTNGFFISADHVTEHGDCKADGKPVTIVYADKDKDYSVFYAPDTGGNSAYSCDGYTPGETYVARGFAHGWDIDRQEPWIATSLVIDGQTAFVGTGEPGMSGGPVFNTRGEVVGIVNMR